MQIFLFVAAVLLFIGLVLIHEWGHFFAARRNGVQVEEFGLGFPPRAWGKKLKSGMLLSLNWLPIGGFVKLKGEHDSSTKPGSFGAASLSTKTKILLAGVTMNLIAGIFILTILAWIGMPKLLNTSTVGEEQFSVASDTKITHQEVQAGYIRLGSPADRLGLKNRDAILKITSGGQTRNIASAEQLHSATTEFGGQNVQITYKHTGKEVTKNTTLLTKTEVEASQKTDDPKGYLGIIPNELQIRRSTWSAPIVAIGFTKQLVVLTTKGLWHALSGLGSAIAGIVTQNRTARENGQTQASSQVGGPVAIMAILWGSGALGINFVLMIVAIISLTLAFMNILPLPALDGGRLLMVLISRGILRRPLSKQAEEKIIGGAVALILTLAVLITIVDVKRFF